MSTTRSAAARIAGSRELLNVLRFDKQGLVPTVIQDATSKRVLTLCYLNREALKTSLAQGSVYVFRRSLKRLMQKGEMSGHIQIIREVQVDCEGKSLVFLVQQHVAGCHAGYFSCYYRRLTRGRLTVGERRVFNPATVYRS